MGKLAEEIITNKIYFPSGNTRLLLSLLQCKKPTCYKHDYKFG